VDEVSKVNTLRMASDTMNDATTRGTTADVSKGPDARETASRAEKAALVFAFLGGLGLIAAELLPLIEVRTEREVVDRITGHEQHGWGLGMLGLAVALLAALAARTRSALPALGLAAIALTAGAIIGFGDVPDIRETGLTPEALEPAEASPQAAFYVEVLAAWIILLAAGSLAAMRRPRRNRPPG
jgi:hypothetical protein